MREQILKSMKAHALGQIEKHKMNVSIFLDNITLGSYNNFFKPNRTKKDWISSDNDNVDNYIDD